MKSAAAIGVPQDCPSGRTHRMGVEVFGMLVELAQDRASTGQPIACSFAIASTDPDHNRGQALGP